MIGCLSLYCFMVFGPPSLLLDGPGTTMARTPATSIQAYGRTNACRSWTDGCTICSKAGTDQAQCSTPGIACTPTTVSCTAPAP